MSEDSCIDNRFEIIDKAQRLLIKRTNITDAPDEMKVLYSILYRCWQMGWLDRLDGTIADMQADNAEHIVRQNVERENAKLRELVRIAGTYCVNGMCGKDDGCPLYLGKPYCALPDRMRELGVDA